MKKAVLRGHLKGWVLFHSERGVPGRVLEAVPLLVLQRRTALLPALFPALPLLPALFVAVLAAPFRNSSPAHLSGVDVLDGPLVGACAMTTKVLDHKWRLKLSRSP